MPDQEGQDFWNEEQVVETPVDQQEEVVQAAPETVVPANQALIAERQAAQQEARSLREELHALRVAGLQQAAAPMQNADPIGTAMKKLESEMDPDAFKFTAPGYKLVLQELHAMRQREDQLVQRNQYLESTVNEIAQEARSRKVYSQLSQAIPDLDVIGPKLTELLGKESAEVQKMYIDNPSLLVPMANAIRAVAGTKQGKNAQVEQAKVAMDLGAGGRATQVTADTISGMKPGSEAFAKIQESFWDRA